MGPPPLPLLTGCVTLGSLFNVSVLQFTRIPTKLTGSGYTQFQCIIVKRCTLKSAKKRDAWGRVEDSSKDRLPVVLSSGNVQRFARSVAHQGRSLEP